VTKRTLAVLHQHTHIRSARLTSHLQQPCECYASPSQTTRTTRSLRLHHASSTLTPLQWLRNTLQRRHRAAHGSHFPNSRWKLYAIPSASNSCASARCSRYRLCCLGWVSSRCFILMLERIHETVGVIQSRTAPSGEAVPAGGGDHDRFALRRDV